MYALSVGNQECIIKMAIYENLPVFKEVYDLLLQFITLSRNLKRDFRYTIGEQIKRDVLDVCVFIYHANACHDKTVFINKAREKEEYKP